jgi:hypothetical protein
MLEFAQYRRHDAYHHAEFRDAKVTAALSAALTNAGLPLSCNLGWGFVDRRNSESGEPSRIANVPKPSSIESFIKEFLELTGLVMERPSLLGKSLCFMDQGDLDDCRDHIALPRCLFPLLSDIARALNLRRGVLPSHRKFSLHYMLVFLYLIGSICRR